MEEKLILFDWGNIVEADQIGYTNRAAWIDLVHAGGSKESDIDKIFNILSKYKLTAITNTKDFEKAFNGLAYDFNFNVTFDEFVKIYKKIFDKIDYYQEVADYEVSLKDKCRVGILSNLIIFDKERLDRQVDLSKYDYAFLSFELGCRKPDIEIYQKIQDQLSIKKENILFIDDKKKNIDAAKEFGWNAVQVTGLELDKIKEVCENFIK